MCIFYFWIESLLSYWHIRDFSRNKSWTTYPRPMLSPGGRNWQLIYPNLKYPFSGFKTLSGFSEMITPNIGLFYIKMYARNI
jgi:hypothetical protein